MHRLLHKPVDVSTSHFYAHVVEMNQLFQEFLSGNDNSLLPHDELKEILKFALTHA